MPLKTLQQLEIVCRPFTHPSLNYEYGYDNWSWANHLARRLNWIGAIPALKCEEQDRPSGVLKALDSERGCMAATVYKMQHLQHEKAFHFKGSKSWVYFDNLMPRFLAEYKKSCKDEEDKGERQEKQRKEKRGKRRKGRAIIYMPNSRSKCSFKWQSLPSTPLNGPLRCTSFHHHPHPQNALTAIP